LIRLLEPDELCSELLAVEVIGHLQCEHIRSQTTRVDKNNELVDVLVRRSYADLRQFVATLQATGQRHVADVLISGGGRLILQYTVPVKYGLWHKICKIVLVFCPLDVVSPTVCKLFN